MPRVLRNLRIDDVSSVDTGAGRGVRVIMTKRAQDRLDQLAMKPLPELYAMHEAGRISANALEKVCERAEELGKLGGRKLPTQHASQQSFPDAGVGDVNRDSDRPQGDRPPPRKDQDMSGSKKCENCGATLKGKYCSDCGSKHGKADDDVDKRDVDSEFGVVGIRKGIETGILDVGEMMVMLNKRAQDRRLEGESFAQAFTKCFTGHSPRDPKGQELYIEMRELEQCRSDVNLFKRRREYRENEAQNAAKRDAGHPAPTLEFEKISPEEANRRLDHLADAYHEKHPELTKAQAYAKAYMQAPPRLRNAAKTAVRGMAPPTAV
jgi:hypothetical protein